jgi:Glycosyl transferase family 2
MTPRLSVLMAVYNAERFAGAAIDSILAQTYADFELVIVLDGPTDGSARIVESYRDPRIRVIAKTRNEGHTRALNDGLRTIASEYVARHDADDLSFPDRFAKQVEWLDRHPEVAVLGVQAQPIDAAGRRLRRTEWDPRWHRPLGGAAMDWYRMFDGPLFHPGVMFRRAVVEAAGGYDERYLRNEDSDLWRRVARQHAIANLDERLIAFRMHPASMTADPTRPEHAGFAERRIDIVHDQMCRVLRRDVPLRWAELWQRVDDPWRPSSTDEVREMAAIVEQCFERFVELHPSASRDREIAMHRASLYLRLFRKAPSAVLWRATCALAPRAALLALSRIPFDFVRRLAR